MSDDQPALLPSPVEIVSAWLADHGLRTVDPTTLKSSRHNAGHLVERKRVRHAMQSYIVLGDIVQSFNPKHTTAQRAYAEAVARRDALRTDAET